ncbi:MULTISPECIES: DUF6281 family protein [Streptomyces]|uniref:DUF6281 family protein n=1 Tax=Streptomyces poriferorum TaxID=2798799 RepID=A0ABY9IPI8_9ACTN|nr:MULTISPECIES: DUF6281 family protein [unclassified Streptomyces]MDP5313787.1 DUF6281 family protein [Streptomyces sp. Alt4]WLQ57258.1 DUF6281 family protein [Streptomyces sp. Alt2]WSI64870.1 DUF6281 family protein [Streptomyces sp. NBC_01336]
MNWTRRSAGLLVAAAMVMSVAACTADGGGGGGEAGGGSDAGLYTYKDQTYLDMGNVEFTVGKKLGVAHSTTGDDAGGAGENEEPAATEAGTAYEVDGISPEVAIAIGDTPKTATLFSVRSGKEIPPEVQKLIDGS